jgi:hypothetical protein
MQLRHVDSLQVIENFPVLNELTVQSYNELERISNLPLLSSDRHRLLSIEACQ